MAAFDWYQGTVRTDPDELIGAVLELDPHAELSHAKGLQGYAHRTLIRANGDSLGEVWHGGTHAYPHAQFTSEAAIAGSQLLRDRFDHTVSRVDAREDFGDADAFDKLMPSLLRAASKHRVQVDTRGDHLLRKEARTVYLGAPSSAVRCRQYDKAAQLRAEFANEPAKLLEVPAHLTRLEVQVRPQSGPIRKTLTELNPLEIMGSSQWMRDIWRDISGLELECVQVTKPWRASDDDRAWQYLLGAFGPLLRRRMEDHGSWAAFGAQIGHDLDERAAAEAKLKRGH